MSEINFILDSNDESRLTFPITLNIKSKLLNNKKPIIENPTIEENNAKISYFRELENKINHSNHHNIKESFASYSFLEDQKFNNLSKQTAQTIENEKISLNTNQIIQFHQKKFQQNRNLKDQYFPDKSFTEKLDNYKKSTFIKEIQKDKNKSEGAAFEENKDVYDEYMRNCNEKNRILRKIEKINESETIEEESENEEKIDKFVIHPRNIYKRKWDIYIIFILTYCATVCPYRIAFIDSDSPEDKKFEMIDYLIDVSFLIDIVLNFFIAYEDREDNLIVKLKPIVLNYLKFWFWMDLITIFPFSKILWESHYDFLNLINASSQQNLQSSSNKFSNFKINQISRIIRIPKLYKLFYMSKFLKVLRTEKSNNSNNRITRVILSKLRISANQENMLIFILAFFILTHFSACIWFLLAKWENFSPCTWVARLGLMDESNFDLYLLSFYWTLTTVTTVGYGDVTSYTNSEKVYNLIIMACGVLMYSFAIGSLTNLVIISDKKSSEINQKLMILKSIKTEFKVDEDIYQKIRKVIKFDMGRIQRENINFLHALPNKLKKELSKIIHESVIKKFSFFQNQSLDFISNIADNLQPLKVNYNDVLYNTLEVMDEMFFVSKGMVALSMGPEYHFREIKEFKRNSNFGEVEMCLNEELIFNIRIKSRSCELFVLKKIDFLKVSVNFKKQIETFLKKSLLVYLSYNEKIKKIIEDIEGIQVPIHTKIIDKDKSISRQVSFISYGFESSEESKILNTEGNAEEFHNFKDYLPKITEKSQENTINNKETFVLNKNNCLENANSKDFWERRGSDSNSTFNKDLFCKESNRFYLKKMHTKDLLEKNSIRLKVHSPKYFKNKYLKKLNSRKLVRFYSLLNKQKFRVEKKFSKEIENIINFFDKIGVDFEKYRLEAEDNPIYLLKSLIRKDKVICKNEILNKINRILSKM